MSFSAQFLPGEEVVALGNFSSVEEGETVGVSDGATVGSKVFVGKGV